MYVLQPFSIDTADADGARASSGYQYPTPGFVIFKHLDMHDFCDVKDLGNDGFPDMHYPDTYWCTMLSDQTDVICIGCRDGASGQLLGLITVAPDAERFLPSAQKRAGDIAMLFNYYGKCAYITSLCVHSAYRRLGFARQLIAKAIEELRALPNPAALIFLHVADDNAGAVRFYTRSGFSAYCTIPGYYRTRSARSHAALSDTATVYALSLCPATESKTSSSSSKQAAAADQKAGGSSTLANLTSYFFSSIKASLNMSTTFG